MSDKLFEVAFSGQISDGSDLDEVKARVGAMFKADEAKLAQLFSGKRIVIKKSVDQSTATKYQTALARAGAECELKPLFVDDEVVPGQIPESAAEKSTPDSPSSTPTNVAADPAPQSSPEGVAVQSAAPESAELGDAPPPPNTDPLGISGDQIEELSATVAAVGSELQDEIKEVAAPAIDISDLDVAPVGSTIGPGKKEPDPPPPDTSGISMAD